MDPSQQQPKGRAKGRARGRARGATPVQPPGPAQASQVGQAPQQPSRATYRGADRPGGLQSRQQGGAEALPEAFAGLKVESSSSGNGNGNNNNNGNGNGTPAGRGVMRGRREIAQILTTRPSTVLDKTGTCGTAINLYANYFGMQKKENWMLCLHHVDFNPSNEDRTHERKKLLRQHQKYLGEGYLFDGMQLYLGRKIDNKSLVSKDEKTGENYQIKIRFIKELKPLDSQFIQILNILLRRCQDHLGLKLLGRNYYNPNAETREPAYSITVWPGFSTSIRQHERAILLNVDVTHKFLRQETVLDVLKKIMRTTGQYNSILGSVVMTSYNEKTYRIDDIDMQHCPMNTFPYRGAQISYFDYYRQKYNVQIRDVKQPLLISKPKKRDIRRGMEGNIVLVPELCLATGLTEEMRSDFNTMRNLAKYMRMTPDKRIQALKQFNSDLSRNDNVKKELTQWGLRLEPELVQVQGRLLPDEAITQGNRTFSYARISSEWSRESRGCSLSMPIELRNWACVFPHKFTNEAQDLLSNLQKVAGAMGMRMARPDMISLRTDSTQDFISQLNTCAGKQMVVLVLPSSRAERYGAIKKHLSVNMAIPSQCVLSKTLSKKQRLMSVATKVAIQMNCKLGGEVWSVAVPMKSCMVIGYDAYHDSLRKGDSYGAVVSSLNPLWTKYFGQVNKHTNREELTDNFSSAVKLSLEAFMRENRTLPNTVIVFRDGVGDGQVPYVKEHEIAAIRATFQKVYGGKEPKFAFVIVSKRINTRLFLRERQDVKNPPPGTVVDTVITLPERYDFYLIPQSVNQGTVTPTSFNVIEDTSGLKPDHMQRIAYKLTHLYYNWQGTVRVPAPCLYAHKLAFMTGTAVHEMPHRNLADKLWYL